MPGLIRGVARTAAVVGTANAVSHKQQQKYAAQDQQAAQAAAYQQQQYAPPPQQQYAPPPPAPAPRSPRREGRGGAPWPGSSSIARSLRG